MEESDLAPDIYSSLEVGLRNLLELLPQDQLENALTLQYRLIQNIADARQTGETDQLKAERAKILLQLNRLALANVGKSFNDLTPTLVLPKPEEDAPAQAKGVTENYSLAEQASLLPLLFPALGADFNYFLYVCLGLTLFSCYFFGAPFLFKTFTPANPPPPLLVSPRPTVGENLPSATVPPAPATTAPPASPTLEATNPPPNSPTFTATPLPTTTFTATPLPSYTPTFTLTPSPAPSPYPAPASPTFTPTETPVPPTNTSSTNTYPHSSG